MATVFWRGGLSISILVRQAKLEQSCNQRALQEPHDGNRQQLHFIPYLIQKAVRNVLHHGHHHLVIRQRVLQSFGRSKQPSGRDLHTFLLPQSCWMHWVAHVTDCVQGAYVICSSKGIQWCCGTYLLRGVINWLAVESTCMLVEFCHSYDDFDCFNAYGRLLELWLSLYSAVQTRHVLQNVWMTRRNGLYVWVPESSTRQLDQNLWILPACLLPFFPFLRDTTLMDMEKQLSWRNFKSTIERFGGRSWSLFLVLWTLFSTQKSLCFVRTVVCSNVILSSVHGQLTTSKTFTCVQSTSPIALWAKLRNNHPKKGIHFRRN